MMVLEKALVKAWGHHWTCQWRFCCLTWKSSPPLLYYVTPWDTKRCKTKCFTDRQLVKHFQLKTFWCLNWVQRKEDSKWKGQNSTMVCGVGLVPSPTYICFHVCLCWLLNWPLLTVPSEKVESTGRFGENLTICIPNGLATNHKHLEGYHNQFLLSQYHFDPVLYNTKNGNLKKLPKFYYRLSSIKLVEICLIYRGSNVIVHRIFPSFYT